MIVPHYLPLPLLQLRYTANLRTEAHQMITLYNGHQF